MSRTVLPSLAAAALLAACGDSSTTTPPASQQLTFQGDATFVGPHAGQTVRAALLDGSTVLEIKKTTVATVAATDPSFSFLFTPVLDPAKAYTVHYWIDSNFGAPAGGAGACDPKANDHQWAVSIPAGQASRKESHSGATTTDVCSTFTFPLTFRADTTFNGPHANNTFRAALVRGAETTALEVIPGTVAAAGANPALSVTFTPELVIGEDYSVKLWVDFNANGTCEAPGTDHQWSATIPTALGSPETFTYGPHSTAFTDVCSLVFP
jgi:hypothetical protein